MRVGFYQSSPVFGEVQANVDRTVQDLSAIDADLLVLPELFNCGYQFVSKEETVELAEEIPAGKTSRAIMGLARNREIFVVFGLAERDGTEIYNSAALVGPLGFLGKYRKIHLFNEEKSFFGPGDNGFQVFDLGPAKIGIMICFDWLFPESARTLTLLGADIICHPANLVLPHCQKAMVTRSLENGVFTITANRVGTESRGGKDPLTFTGGSQIVDNLGRVLTKLGQDDTGVVLTDIEPVRSRNKSITAHNDRLRDRRPEFYGPLTDQVR